MLYVRGFLCFGSLRFRVQGFGLDGLGLNGFRVGFRVQRFNIGALIIRIGFGAHYTILIVRTPPKKIVLSII